MLKPDASNVPVTSNEGKQMEKPVKEKVQDVQGEGNNGLEKREQQVEEQGSLMAAVLPFIDKSGYLAGGVTKVIQSEIPPDPLDSGKNGNTS